MTVPRRAVAQSTGPSAGASTGFWDVPGNLVAMADGRNDDDLDWLYRRDPEPKSEPEHTRIMSETEQAELARAVERRQHPQGAPPPPTRQPGQAPPSARQQSRKRGSSGSQPPGGPPPGKPVKEPKPPRKRKRRPVRTFFRTVGVLILIALVYLVGVPVYAWSSVARVDDDPGGDRPGNQPGNTYLLVGSDSREGLTEEEKKRLGTGSAEGQRTDTIMMLHVPTTGDPVLVSIPRDSYLPIPDNGENKINAAYAFGGPELLVQTVETNTGVRIDGYLEVGFGGFVNVIDALGGIEMCLDEPAQDDKAHIDLPAGCQNLNGVNALGYVRMRSNDPTGDLARVKRQREMLSAMADKAASPASVLNPIRYWKLNKAAATSVGVGQETGITDVGRLALAMRSVAGGSGLTLTVPIGNPNASTGAGSAVLWDEEKAGAMFAEIAAGDTSELDRFAE